MCISHIPTEFMQEHIIYCKKLGIPLKHIDFPFTVSNICTVNLNLSVNGFQIKSLDVCLKSLNFMFENVKFYVFKHHDYVFLS